MNLGFLIQIAKIGTFVLAITAILFTASCEVVEYHTKISLTFLRYSLTGACLGIISGLWIAAWALYSIEETEDEEEEQDNDET